MYYLGGHTSENLLKEYEAVTAQYNIENKIVRLITDNASNNIKAFGSLIVPGFEPYFEESFDEFSDEFGEVEADEESAVENENGDEICHWCDISLGNDELLRLPCFIHTLQLVVSDVFK